MIPLYNIYLKMHDSVHKMVDFPQSISNMRILTVAIYVEYAWHNILDVRVQGSLWYVH